MSFFNDPGEAKRYAQNRPYFHPIAIKRACDVFEISTGFPLAVDIACGTGQSAKALSAIAERVVGVDISRSMLTAAEREDRLEYIQARAEALPFKNGRIPILTSALAFHWLDREQFLKEAWRVLNEEGLLMIYNNGFRGVMRENPSFSNWGSEEYTRRFPVPPRDSRPITNQTAEMAGFQLVQEDSYENDIRFTPEQLAAYLTTQTNVVAAIEQGQVSLESAHDWLLSQIQPYFSGTAATFVFNTRAWYLKKQADT